MLGNLLLGKSPRKRVSVILSSDLHKKEVVPRHSNSPGFARADVLLNADHKWQYYARTYIHGFRTLLILHTSCDDNTLVPTT